MANIWKKIKNHYKQKSTFAIISDIIFYAFIIALIFTPSRNWLVSHLQRLAMLSPRQTKHEVRLQPMDWSWAVLDSQGQTVRLADLRGKVILINFWATWCAPCLAELPALQDLYDHYKDNPDIAFLFVTTEGLDKAQSFLAKKGYSIPVYRQISPAPGPLQSNSIPSTYLIDRQGRIVAQAHRATRWNSKKSIQLIDKLLKQKP